MKQTYFAGILPAVLMLAVFLACAVCTAPALSDIPGTAVPAVPAADITKPK